MSTPFPSSCPDCGTPFPADLLDAPCRRCLLQLAEPLFAPPEQIAEYEIERELGRGSMGTVYLAIQPVTRKLVALKVLREELLDERGLRWFAEEIAILGKLEHPHIVSIYDGKGLYHRPLAFYV
ncbi:MAG: hypothetical protein RL701_1535, partial [Pseudomonadota bacterium]